MDANATPPQPSKLWLVAFFFTVLSLAGISTYFLYAFSRLMERSLTFALPNRPLPPLTTLFIDYRLGILWLPAPWLVFAAYSLTRRSSSAHVLIFYSASLILALGALCVVYAVAFAIPWMPQRLSHAGTPP